MDVFELIKKFYGRGCATAIVSEKGPPSPELPPMGQSLEIVIDEVDRLRKDNAGYKVMFKEQVEDVVASTEEINIIKAQHWMGADNDPYHSRPGLSQWGYVDSCPTCRIIRHSEKLKEENDKFRELLKGEQ